MKTKEKISEEDSDAGRETKKGRRENVETREVEEENKTMRKEGRGECEEAEGCKKTEEEEAAKVRRKGGNMEEEESEGSKGQQEAEKEKEIPMSLRKFGMEGPGKGWVNAFTSITKELG